MKSGRRGRKVVRVIVRLGRWAGQIRGGRLRVVGGRGSVCGRSSQGIGDGEWRGYGEVVSRDTVGRKQRRRRNTRNLWSKVIGRMRKRKWV
jgi:hypothetical protein